jgi:hypothetical protein
MADKADTVLLSLCPACKVAPGGRHLFCCRFDICAYCGQNLDYCEEHDGEDWVPWRGESVGLAEAREYGLWCVNDSTTCRSDHPNARPDVELLRKVAIWDARRQRFVLKDSK